MAVGTLLAVGSAISGFFGARRARRRARREARRAAGRQMVAEANRQDIPDFQADMANPYANLQVATQAAEMQAEQADIALASSLDALRATGAGAGGATALARAAAQSKRGVAASIEKQEARNAQLRAQGEMQAAQMRQTGQIAQFRAQEARDDMEIQRQAGLGFAAQQQESAARSAQTQAIGAAIGAVGTFADEGGFKNLFGGGGGGSSSTTQPIVNTPAETLIQTQFAPDPNINMSQTQINPYTAPNFGNLQGQNVINSLSGFGLSNDQLLGISNFKNN
jgi:hypothetical protein